MPPLPYICTWPTVFNRLLFDHAQEQPGSSAETSSFVVVHRLGSASRDSLEAGYTVNPSRIPKGPSVPIYSARLNKTSQGVRSCWLMVLQLLD